MLNYRRTILLSSCLILLLWLGASCRKKPEEGIPTKRHPLDGPVTLEMKPDPTNASSHVVCVFKTKKLYPCTAFGLHYRISGSQEHIFVYLEHVVEFLAPCLMVLTPAACSITVPIPGNGDVWLDVAVKDKVWQGKLLGTPETIEMKGLPGLWVELTGKTKYNRMRPRTLYGSINYNATDEDLALALADSIYYYGLQGDVYPPGDYCYFTVDESGQPHVPGQTLNSVAVLGLLPANEQPLREFLDRARQNYSNLNFNLITDRGVSY